MSEDDKPKFSIGDRVEWVVGYFHTAGSWWQRRTGRVRNVFQIPPDSEFSYDVDDDVSGKNSYYIIEQHLRPLCVLDRLAEAIA